MSGKQITGWTSKHMGDNHSSQLKNGSDENAAGVGRHHMPVESAFWRLLLDFSMNIEVVRKEESKFYKEALSDRGRLLIID